MKYIDSEKLVAEINRVKDENAKLKWACASQISSAAFCKDEAYDEVLSFITSLQQEQPEVDLDKLVNEEFASHSQTTEYGLEVTYNRAELYQLIKSMALVFNSRKEE